MVARPVLERLDTVRGEVALTVLRPPTFEALAETVRWAAEAGGRSTWCISMGTG